MSERSRKQRLFFALWPDEVTREALARLLSSIPSQPGRQVAVSNLHITLAFIGNVDDAMSECLQARAEKVRGAPFSMTMSTLGYFRRAKVLWLGPDSCPLPLQSLVAQLNAKLASCGYRPDKRPFSPHLTLFRKAALGKLHTEIDPLRWKIGGFSMVRSSIFPRGAEYHVIRYYPLHHVDGDRSTESVHEA
jgi:2'-5' RNA ligase